jgi:MFS family permease
VEFPVATDAPVRRLTLTEWLVLIMAAIGFGFDIYVLLIMQYIGRDTLTELLPEATPDVRLHWNGLLFFIPAFVGGIFGLLGGYLTDLLGRRRVLTASILLYAFATLASGFATSVTMFLILRCLTFIGVCVEFVAAVAWLAELFPSYDRRERALGYTQAFSSLGGLTVAQVFHLINNHTARLPALVLPEFLVSWLGPISNAHAAWRYTLISGVVPAIPLIIIRPFLPESPAWRAKKAAGTLKRPSFREVFAPGLLRTTLVTTIMFACSYGAAFGAIQQVQHMVAAMPPYQERVANLKEETKLKGQRPPTRAVEQQLRNEMTSEFGTVQEIGGLLGRFLLAYLAVRILSRRALLRVFQLPGLIIVPLVFAFGVVNNHVLFTLPLGESTELTVNLFHVGIFLAGLLTVAQFSFWGNYLPRVYPLHLRGTGQSVAANIGGRMMGTSFALVTSELARQQFMPGTSSEVNMAYAAAIVALFVYLVGTIFCFFLPEPKQMTLVD